MSHVHGPLGVDPLYFSFTLFCLLILFVMYLLLPRGLRVQYFKAYPKRYQWSARARRRTGSNQRGGGHPGSTMGGGSSVAMSGIHSQQGHRQIGSVASAYSGAGGSRVGVPRGSATYLSGNEDSVAFNEQSHQGGMPGPGAPRVQHPPQQLLDLQQNDEIVISAAMQQLRDPGVLIVAHGSRGKPKTVRLQLTETAITWRTETRKKSSTGAPKEPKMGKLHSVPLSHIMYVDVGKQTTALRRVENAAVSEALCFSLLTKEGSLDLEANSPRERDALVSCFSLVLDEVHAQNWRDIYRGPSSEMPSSFDDVDDQAAAGNANQGGVAGNV
eukprot:CAMPEP_0183295296 /NCGR_PEP_ID=MMETSP0160_2-20130417/3305_1 /TAXON_ID=2839 ORGANISM="Odontella Sinensis, Strain Grunow 1884" /NCGR_SAMPLE_ID=MMETSP0160_2 /ASSEMBLY_ACC=CAM_ASM_000250 /LENGTH=327 /DNA_ID=CAMNT_0025456757 /DNA_START=90 /DNA_END=1073 /DNA_ORIENTATION=-